MRFEKYLSQNLVPEWKYYYVPYKALKKLIKSITKVREAQTGSPSVQSQAGRRMSVLRRSDSFDSRDENEDMGRSIQLRYRQVVEGGRRDSLIALGLSNVELTTKDHITMQPAEDGYHVTVVPTSISASAQEQEFFAALDKQVKRIDTFYKKQQGELTEMWNKLAQQVQYLELQQRNSRSSKRLLRHGFLELYKALGYLQNYSVNNYTAFVKILKKHDKVCKWQTSKDYLQKVDTYQFPKHHDTMLLVTRCEKTYAEVFCQTDRSVAMAELRDGPRDAEHVRESRGNYFYIGLYTGICMVLAYAVIDLIWANPPDSIVFAGLFVEWPIYRGLFLLLLHLGAFAVNCAIWEKYRVNYRFIFQYDSSTKPHVGSAQVYRIFTGLCIIVLAFFVIEIYCAIELAYPEILAMTEHSKTIAIIDGLNKSLAAGILMFILLAMLLFPLNIWYRNARIVTAGLFAKTIFTPLSPVDFRVFWLADQLCSQTRALADFVYMCCFLFFGSFLKTNDNSCSQHIVWFRIIAYMFPYLIRFLQCVRRFYDTRQTVPHVLNAGKYFAAICVILTNAFGPTWLFIIISTISTLYSYSWDIVMDWGLAQNLKYGEKRFLLRNELMYNGEWKYYFAMITNFFLRITWVTSVSPRFIDAHIKQEFAIFLFGALEVIRRGQWNVYRLENEQLNNCGQFRAVAKVPLPFSMDEIRQNASQYQQLNESNDKDDTLMDSPVADTVSETASVEGSSEATPSRRGTVGRKALEEAVPALMSGTSGGVMMMNLTPAQQEQHKRYADRGDSNPIPYMYTPEDPWSSRQAINDRQLYDVEKDDGNNDAVDRNGKLLSGKKSKAATRDERDITVNAMEAQASSQPAPPSSTSSQKKKKQEDENLQNILTTPADFEDSDYASTLDSPLIEKLKVAHYV